MFSTYYKNNKILLTIFSCGIFLSFSSRAATVGTITINGNVPIVCEITVTSSTSGGVNGTENIGDISLGGTDIAVATVNEKCNDPDGYTVTIAGTNSTDETGLLTDTVSGDTHPFSVTYDNVAVSSPTVADVGAISTGVDTSKVVEITYAVDASLTGTVASTYTETLTFTIAAK